MRLAKRLGDAALTTVAAVGLVCALLWVATTAGWVQPLVVVSGSMEPQIRTGDLLVAVRAPVDELAPGDVVTLPSTATGGLVTHRITELRGTGPDAAEVRMRGDANAAQDAEVYAVEGSVWRPAVRVPGGGFVAERLSRPSVAVPLLVTLAALVGLALVPSPPGRESADGVAPRELVSLRPRSGVGGPERAVLLARGELRRPRSRVRALKVRALSREDGAPAASP